ncbi:MAG: MmcQ/YjbR family DNA-binding protein [Flavobacteriales bacterium]|jgi:predicted DNA-binding protein (MmcQ/YjbR family)
MDIVTFREYCLSKPHTSEHLPFDETTLVFKVGTRMFALCDIDRFRSINLKCDPEQAIQLREAYPAIRPGYHMSKVHWNTIELDGSLDDSFILGLVDHSYELVWKSMTKAERTKLNG